MYKNRYINGTGQVHAKFILKSSSILKNSRPPQRNIPPKFIGSDFEINGKLVNCRNNIPSQIIGKLSDSDIFNTF